MDYAAKAFYPKDKFSQQMYDDEINFFGLIGEHANIIKYIGKTQPTHIPQIMVLEYCAGGSLISLIQKRPLQESQAAFCIYQLIKAVAFVHKLENFIHR